MIAAPEYAFVTPAPIFRAGDAVSSPSAVARARTLSPVFALNALGYEAAAFSLSAADAALPAILRRAKVVVLGEAGAATAPRYRPLLAELADRAVLDIVRIPAAADLPAAAALSAASEHVADRLRAFHIPDACAGPAFAPSAARAPRASRILRWLGERAGLAPEALRIRLLWSGEEEEDADAIAHAYPALEKLGQRMPLLLRCVCLQGPALESAADRLIEKDPDALRIALEAWSPPAMSAALAACNLVLLPSAAGLLGAIYAGRFAIAQPSPYYGPLADFAWIGEDVAEGIAWALAHPEEVLHRIARGQEYVNRVHAPEIVARAWIQLFLGMKK